VIGEPSERSTPASLARHSLPSLTAGLESVRQKLAAATQTALPLSRYPFPMNQFLRAAYGDPCRECRFEWSVGPAECGAIVSNAPARFRSLLTGHDGKETHPNLEWSATAYVVHVADVLRIWSDRIAAVALGASDPVVPYDEDRLGDARGYMRLPLPGALWSLDRAVGDWLAAEQLAESAPVSLAHPEQGPLPLDDVRRIMAHEIEHHVADLMLIVSS
jgi:hypothetical protein